MVNIPGKTFSMLNTEVTQKLYVNIMRRNPSFFKGDNNPVESVTLIDAISFCNKLSEKFGFTSVYSVKGDSNPDRWKFSKVEVSGVYYKFLDGTLEQNASANGFRLPTEDEWKLASIYAGFLQTELIKREAWYRDNSFGRTSQVAQKYANRYGLYDMLGNVKEMCLSNSGEGYCCGESYKSGLTSFNRFNEHSTPSRFAYDDVGFRIVRNIE